MVLILLLQLQQQLKANRCSQQATVDKLELLFLILNLLFSVLRDTVAQLKFSSSLPFPRPLKGHLDHTQLTQTIQG